MPGPDAVCLACGYDLAGLPASGDCPECALPIARSLDRPPLLRGADPGWLQRTHRGLSGLAAAMRVLLWVILVVVGSLIVDLLFRNVFGLDPGGVVHEAVLEFALFAALLASAVLHLRGTWLMTGGTFGGYAPPARARFIVRWTGLLLPFCGGSTFVWGSMVAGLPPKAQFAVAGVMQLVAVAYLLGLARLLEALERRTPDWSADHALRYRNVRKNIYGVLIIVALSYWFIGGPRRAGDWGGAWFGLAYVLMGQAVSRVRAAAGLELAIDRAAGRD